MRGLLIKKQIDDFSPGLNVVHSNIDDPDIGTQPHEENTIFPSRIIIQDSMVQSSVTFQYPLPWQHNATSPTVSRLVTALKHAASCSPLSITIYSPDYTRHT